MLLVPKKINYFKILRHTWEQNDMQKDNWVVNLFLVWLKLINYSWYLHVRVSIFFYTTAVLIKSYEANRSLMLVIMEAEQQR
jgi:hypothetical protein